MDVKYQVFISSTFQDLQTERRLVTEQVLNLGHIPVGMELFQAADDNQWSYIKRRIEQCDYYIALVAERYGSQRDGKSYTRLEYEYAVKKKVPVAAFLLHDDARASWPQKNIQFEYRDRVDQFRTLCQRKIVKYWRNGDDLAAKVATTLVEQMREYPRTGWVRGDAVATSVALNEIAKLSEERRALQDRVSSLEAERDPGRPPGDMLHRLRVLDTSMCSGFLEQPIVDQDTSLLKLFVDISRTVAVGVTQTQLMVAIQKGLKAQVAPGEIIAEMVTNNLIELVTTTTPNGLHRMYYLTDYSKQMVMYGDRWFDDPEWRSGIVGEMRS